jgi:hypothetical protein
MSATVDATTDRYGRPLSPDPDAVRVETDPAAVHQVDLGRPRQYRSAIEAGAGVDWYDRHAWTTETVLHVPRGHRTGSDRWGIGYLDDAAVVNHGEGRARTQGRHLFLFEHASCISAEPLPEAPAVTARVGDLVILRCLDLDGTVAETVAARIVPTGWGGAWLTLQLVQR